MLDTKKYFLYIIQVDFSQEAIPPNDYLLTRIALRRLFFCEIFTQNTLTFLHDLFPFDMAVGGNRRAENIERRSLYALEMRNNRGNNLCFNDLHIFIHTHTIKPPLKILLPIHFHTLTPKSLKYTLS